MFCHQVALPKLQHAQFECSRSAEILGETLLAKFNNSNENCVVKKRIGFIDLHAISLRLIQAV